MMTTQALRRRARQAVTLGAAVLDVSFPGWWVTIDPAALDVSSCSRCVLGQLFSCYTQGICRLYSPDLPAVEQAEAQYRWACQHGFDGYSDEIMPVLTAAWQQLIVARRKEVQMGDIAETGETGELERIRPSEAPVHEPSPQVIPAEPVHEPVREPQPA